MGVIRMSGKSFTNKQFGNALELYYRKGLHGKVNVGEFLNYVFKLNDSQLKRMDTYSDGCMYFKRMYVKD